MKSRINVEAITSKINLDQLGQEIITRSEKGDFRSQSPITVVLDRLRPALLKARENKASFSALARYLNEKQIAISEASLRKYLNQYSDQKAGIRGSVAAHRQKVVAAADKSSGAAAKSSAGEQPVSGQSSSLSPAGQRGVTASAGKPDLQRIEGVKNAPRNATPNIPGLAEH